MRGILIRVGADSTKTGGQWLAPVDPASGRFAYIPITERATAFHPGCERRFDEVADPLFRFLADHSATDPYWNSRMDRKRGRPMHLDPDYKFLTYGDNGRVRGRDLRNFDTGDLIVFYSGLRSIRPATELVYAVVGVYIVDRVLPARSVEPARRAHNAHTRTASIHPDDIVVRARPGVSGRCARCIPIGERRKSSHYYLRSDLESAWGGLVKADGSPWKSAWLNMSGSPPLLGDAPGVLRWWRAQCVELVQDNFVHD